MKIYQIVEHIKGKNKTYTMGFETDKELAHWLEGQELWINEKKDSIVAWDIGKCGEYYVDLEKIWKREENMKRLLKTA